MRWLLSGEILVKYEKSDGCNNISQPKNELRHFTANAKMGNDS